MIEVHQWLILYAREIITYDLTCTTTNIRPHAYEHERYRKNFSWRV